MSDIKHHDIRTALALMRMALALLDRAGCTLAAARLQHASDTVEAGPESAAMPSHSAASSGSGYDRHHHQRGAGKRAGTGSCAHADAIDFFTRPDSALPAADARIFHLTIIFGERSRELAVNEPFEAPELALLIRLTRRAMRDRMVQRLEAMRDEASEAIRTSLDEVTRDRSSWPAHTPARVPRRKPDEP